MVRHELTNDSLLGEDDSLGEITAKLRAQRVRKVNLLVLFLQVVGMGLISLAAFIVHVALGLAVLGCAMVLFGIIVEKATDAR